MLGPPKQTVESSQANIAYGPGQSSQAIMLKAPKQIRVELPSKHSSLNKRLSANTRARALRVGLPLEAGPLAGLSISGRSALCSVRVSSSYSVSGEMGRGKECSPIPPGDRGRCPRQQRRILFHDRTRAQQRYQGLGKLR